MIVGGLNSRGGQLTQGLNPWNALEQLLEIIAIIQLGVLVRAAGAAGVWAEGAHDGWTRVATSRRAGSSLAHQHDAGATVRDDVTLRVRGTDP